MQLLAVQVTVLERTREAGKKILMSGGSRCNVLPLAADPNIDFFTASSRGALRAVLASWALQDCKDWLSSDVGLQLQLEQETNKWFPASNSSREVRDRLVEACQQLGVRFVYNASVEGLQPPQAAAAAAAGADALQETQGPSSSSSSSSSWTVLLASGAKVSAERIIFSTGGRSFPAVGTDGTGLNLLQGAGHNLVAQYAALTPLKGAHPGGQQLAGLTLPSVRLSVAAANKPSKVAAVAQRGGLLFTHKGYSGPAVLDLSHWLVRELDQQQQQAAMPRLLVDWTGEGAEVWQERLAAASGAATVENVLRKAGVKERLAAALAIEVGVQGRQMSQLKKGERQALLAALTAWQLPISSHEGYKKAEVTGGGLPLEQVDCRTMESRLLPGLHVCGEVLDVFGRIGGFNFLWAWVTGRLAGLGAAAQLGLPAAAAAAAPPPQSRARR
ncbi:hypothetical protein OEZ85_013789 [Tetradesmus obliquus]|uniref:FAD-dependent oxidoreductase 2 FAD binding domain-containing protein n=1 Tax=Tetradesmus obliquus TaxID=3088 RepID=A0ABY8U6G5_TETOB|nr:hypothetical protein OEZ85_013789 [Tetradesmus obliquus]